LAPAWGWVEPAATADLAVVPAVVPFWELAERSGFGVRVRSLCSRQRLVIPCGRIEHG